MSKHGNNDELIEVVNKLSEADYALMCIRMMIEQDSPENREALKSRIKVFELEVKTLAERIEEFRITNFEL